MAEEIVIDLVPPSASLRAYAGDPFTFRLEVSYADGSPADVTDWEWRSAIRLEDRRLPFEHRPGVGGVDFWLRGDDTLLPRPGQGYPFDITGRHPDAGEGVTVLRGDFMTTVRVTVPIRNDPDLVPATPDVEPVMT